MRDRVAAMAWLIGWICVVACVKSWWFLIPLTACAAVGGVCCRLAKVDEQQADERERRAWRREIDRELAA